MRLQGNDVLRKDHHFIITTIIINRMGNTFFGLHAAVWKTYDLQVVIASFLK